MNKIIIVGHPQSGYEEVERLLVECGMAPALPSRREKLTPDQISRTLVKAHGATPIENLQSPQQLQQITVAPVWQGMALDLMLANVEQPLWGWADTQAAYLLDYWKSQDPQIVFVLVYDEPRTVYTRLSLEQASAPEAELQRRIDAWVSYNAALLHFHLRNPERSLLVHARQVQTSAQSYLQQISARIDAPLHVPPTLLPELHNSSQEDESQDGDAVVQDNHLAVRDNRAHVAGAPAEPPRLAELQANALADLLASQLVDANPEALQLYDELQAAATLPHGVAQSSGLPPALSGSGSLRDRYQAWLALVAQQAALQEQMQRAQTQAEQLKALSQQFSHADTQARERQRLLDDLHRTHRQAEALAQERQHLLEQQTIALQEQTADRERLCAELAGQLRTERQQLQHKEQERQLLLTQLHQVQEELEQHYLQARQQDTTLQSLRQNLQQVEQQAKQQAAEHSRQVEQLRAARQESQLLLAQLHQVQEELERHYLENQRHALQLEELQKNQEQHLRQIGQLKKERDEHTKTANERKTRLEQLTQAKAAYEKQTQEHNRQAETLKAERQAAREQVKQLQAQLNAAQARLASAPTADLQQENALLLSQLHQVQEELERLYLENRKLQTPATNASISPQPQQPIIRTGAANRVKRELPYRLGSLMIARSHNLGGLLGMPFALRAETKRYREEQQATAGQPPLPPISEYRDAREAEKVKQHLSYRLGRALLQSSEKPLGWLGLPWALRREVKDFRQQRNSRQVAG
ncbi:chromosome partitioning protein ParA [Corticibacter populi]|uniref:Chromosome partitioning protein ParA n=1 Tax=Corticibacter populi TaxID=1550736 RepID=A0A3M6QHN7_9BURK|nr:chromosome partitioning protein ParA [Corticibacter populi]RMX02558.1 chromosome partitioning protein ParA [Corticibacter populi]RZS33037.1 hypothetical protein EV687_1353 [Corticibacter populi]